MEAKAKEIIMKYMMKEETEKTIKRLSVLVNDDIIELLTKDVIVISMVSFPTITTMEDLNLLVSNCNEQLTSNAYKCIDNGGTLISARVSFCVEYQSVTIRYDYTWKEDDNTRKDYDHVTIPVDVILNKHGFMFDVV